MLWLVNLAVALSNLVVLGQLRGASPADCVVMLLAAAGSTLMHLSEVKHGLPGIIPEPALWLWVDRACVALAVVQFTGRLIWATHFPDPDRRADIPLRTLVGLTALAVSETMTSPWYAPLHVVWHYLAFDVMGRLASHPADV